MTRQITTMRAIRNTTHGGPRLLELLEIPVPLRRPGEVLIKVHAAGVAYPDVGPNADSTPTIGPSTTWSSS
jgi:NADPH2:quinone reductase